MATLTASAKKKLTTALIISGVVLASTAIYFGTKKKNKIPANTATALSGVSRKRKTKSKKSSTGLAKKQTKKITMY